MIKIKKIFNNFKSNDDYNYNGFDNYNYNEYNNTYYKTDKRTKISSMKKIITTTITGLVLTITAVGVFSDKKQIQEDSNEISLSSFEVEVEDQELEPNLPKYRSVDNVVSYSNARLISETNTKTNEILESNISNEKDRVKKEKEKEEKRKLAAKRKSTTTSYSSGNPQQQNGSFASFGGNSIYNLSQSERSLLERLLAAEARGEDYKGQLAVASVLANRIESSAFPNSVQGVIYQKSQFSPVSNGKINTVKVNSTQKQVISDVFDKGIRNVPRDVLYLPTEKVTETVGYKLITEEEYENLKREYIISDERVGKLDVIYYNDNYYVDWSAVQSGDNSRTGFQFYGLDNSGFNEVPLSELQFKRIKKYYCVNLLTEKDLNRNSEVLHPESASDEEPRRISK